MGAVPRIRGAEQQGALLSRDERAAWAGIAPQLESVTVKLEVDEAVTEGNRRLPVMRASCRRESKVA